MICVCDIFVTTHKKKDPQLHEFLESKNLLVLEEPLLNEDITYEALTECDYELLRLTLLHPLFNVHPKHSTLHLSLTNRSTVTGFVKVKAMAKFSFMKHVKTLQKETAAAKKSETSSESIVNRHQPKVIRIIVTEQETTRYGAIIQRT